MNIGPHRYTLSIELPDAVSSCGEGPKSSVDPTPDITSDTALTSEVEVAPVVPAH